MISLMKFETGKKNESKEKYGILCLRFSFEVHHLSVSTSSLTLFLPTFLVAHYQKILACSRTLFFLFGLRLVSASFAILSHIPNHLFQPQIIDHRLSHLIFSFHCPIIDSDCVPNQGSFLFGLHKFSHVLKVQAKSSQASSCLPTYLTQIIQRVEIKH
jgi:hypothetical protein